MPEANMMTLPVEIEQITPEWLEQALSAYAPGVKVRGLEMLDMKRSTCTKIRLKLDLEGNRTDEPIPDTVILKGGFEPHSRDMAYMHEMEVRAYAEFLSMGLRHPKPYFTHWDGDAKQGIIIMEDLNRRGVTFCSPLQPQGFEAIAKRLSELARYHACTWNSAEFQAGGKWETVENVMATTHHYFDAYLEPEVWDEFIRSPRGAAVSTRFHERAWMNDALNRMASYSSKLPHCIIHCDTHLGNLYVDNDGTPGFFDSLAARAPAMKEIAYHVCSALDVADRPRLEGALIQHYLAELARAGVQAPSFDEAYHQYGVFLAYGYCIWIINEAFFQSESNNTANVSRFSAAMLDHDTIGKLAAISLE